MLAIFIGFIASIMVFVIFIIIIAFIEHKSIKQIFYIMFFNKKPDNLNNIDNVLNKRKQVVQLEKQLDIKKQDMLKTKKLAKKDLQWIMSDEEIEKSKIDKTGEYEKDDICLV